MPILGTELTTMHSLPIAFWKASQSDTNYNLARWTVSQDIWIFINESLSEKFPLQKIISDLDMLFEIMLIYVIQGLAKQTGQVIGWKQMFLHLREKFLPELKTKNFATFWNWAEICRWCRFVLICWSVQFRDVSRK